MIFTTRKTNGHGASIVKSMIGLALCAVPAVAGSNGVVARGDESEVSTLCTTTSASLNLPAPAIVLSTTGDVDAVSGVPSVTPISSSGSSCAEPVTVSVTVTVSTLQSEDPVQTDGPPISGSVSSSDDITSTITEYVTTTGTITETAPIETSAEVTETSAEVEPATASFIGGLPPFSISSVSEELSTVTTIVSTDTATKTLTSTQSWSVKSTITVATTVTVDTTTVTAGTVGTFVPYAGQGNGNSTLTYSAPSVSVVYPTTTYPAISAANNGGGRGAQVWYCIVMVVAVLGYAL
ncbi:hypothetical protein QBC40DRAFT_350401 [Triangularia verruculosa]|uniref:Uncharacterized protein n=1 Tax=Triangularia verruculosa TaxID=2587418 RepID=A0AAN7ATM9_9PEZI|nr:hypothetical protein QBC40DRAFT_350401 [Triangularia verruculosa]